MSTGKDIKASQSRSRKSRKSSRQSSRQSSRKSLNIVKTMETLKKVTGEIGQMVVSAAEAYAASEKTIAQAAEARLRNHKVMRDTTPDQILEAQIQAQVEILRIVTESNRDTYVAVKNVMLGAGKMAGEVLGSEEVKKSLKGIVLEGIQKRNERRRMDHLIEMASKESMLASAKRGGKA